MFDSNLKPRFVAFDSKHDYFYFQIYCFQSTLTWIYPNINHFTFNINSVKIKFFSAKNQTHTNVNSQQTLSTSKHVIKNQHEQTQCDILTNTLCVKVTQACNKNAVHR
jgi:hypothetical protein